MKLEMATLFYTCGLWGLCNVEAKMTVSIMLRSTCGTLYHNSAREKHHNVGNDSGFRARDSGFRG